MFLHGRQLSVSKALLLLRIADGSTGSGCRIAFNNHAMTSFTSGPDFAGFVYADVAPAFASGLMGTHRFSIEAGGDLAPTATPSANEAACDRQKLLDLMLYVELTL
jgi:hypothetical protein